MILNELLQAAGISRYRLSKVSGIPWATLSDICSGKTKMGRCSAETVYKLSVALGISIEDLLFLSSESNADKLAKLNEELQKKISQPEDL